MPQYIDSYYLVDSRQSKLIYDFFERFSFVKSEMSDEYPIPQYSDDPEKVFYLDSELLLYLENNDASDYIIYWGNLDETSEIKQFTLQYTNDGKMIFGVSIFGNEPGSVESILLFKKVKNYLNSQTACITVEEPPPISTLEFINFCKKRYIPG
ncbi:hypothetical protein QNI16_36280 [Cytophagaceae bacterium YF14B1]|uniref:Uncharacterized protein n=1 Tax=Xanthocytophaga flava TaxID=3048013 RepID=A0AAE3QZB9_9BACT|nr:hypothetical protein [Xanthocytophaga flavus]MDJ1467618.1 hypothetical protein [Xanthocytophaga flavus]MDJ1485996.1 hypothetical protein [Xanthocytophaga flavus]